MQAPSELLGLKFKMEEEAEGLVTLKLLDEEDVLLPDILFEVEYAKLPDRLPRDTIVELDEDETLPVLKDETGTVEKIMLPVDDGGILVMSAMEDTGKLEMEAAWCVTGVSFIVVTQDDGEVPSPVV